MLQPTLVTLFDSKRSMAINIAVKLFRMPIGEITAAVEQFNDQVLTEERLSALQKILPFENDEVQLVTSYDGDYATLAEAEKFATQLFKVCG